MALRHCGCINTHGEEQVPTFEREINRFPNQKRRTSHHQCIRHWACIQYGINGSRHDVNQLQKDPTMIQRSGHCKNMTMMIPSVTLHHWDTLNSHIKLWYGLLRPDEKVFWHTFMTKAQQKIEYRWDDFLADKQAGKISEEEPYEPVKTAMSTLSHTCQKPQLGQRRRRRVVYGS